MSDEQEPDVILVARRALAAAQEAQKAAEADKATPKTVVNLLGRVLQESKAVLEAAEAAEAAEVSPGGSGRLRQRQSFSEFTNLLGEEVMEGANDFVNESMESVERVKRKARSLIEDHFNVDEAFRMLGPLQQDANLARDVHDWFNLVALIPVVALNMCNWHIKNLRLGGVLTGKVSRSDIWHGESFLVFWWTTFIYFVVDALFVMILPRCVKSPGVILKHHIATIGYIFIPFVRPRYDWLMGACMVVEINTWFLIARRAFNKKGRKMFSPGMSLTKSLQMLSVSTCFYVSWFAIRLGFYPYLLFVIVKEWWKESERVGTPINLIALTPVMQCIFLYLNLKWTIDLIRSKMKGRGAEKGL